VQVRLLVSVDRGASLEDARETVDAAIEAFESQNKDHGIVVGVEMGGNPLAGDWSKLSKEFERARAAGLKVSLHFAENEGEEREHNSILDFAPERVGHAVFMSRSVADRLASSKIPVEVRLQWTMDRKRSLAGYHWQTRSDGTKKSPLRQNPLQNTRFIVSSGNLFVDSSLFPNVSRRCA
jgi:hypothetical protein